MENEKKVEETSQEKVSIKYVFPAVSQIDMDNPNDKIYEMVLLKIAIESLVYGSCPLIEIG